ncbi:MAG: HU family DNA-binding protein [Tannerella sp.]|jgi:DNA-binding protein HU-beta|nr:HU family DNA-binding protein [Tannerella sp.]
MNKTEFVGAVAEKAGLSKVDAKKAIDAFIKTVENAAGKGEKVSLLGFGTFSVTEKAARRGVNPKTKESINIPARKVVKFKPGAELAKVVG